MESGGELGRPRDVRPCDPIHVDDGNDDKVKTILKKKTKTNYSCVIMQGDPLHSYIVCGMTKLDPRTP